MSKPVNWDTMPMKERNFILYLGSLKTLGDALGGPREARSRGFVALMRGRVEQYYTREELEAALLAEYRKAEGIYERWRTKADRARKCRDKRAYVEYRSLMERPLHVLRGVGDELRQQFPPAQEGAYE